MGLFDVFFKGGNSETDKKEFSITAEDKKWVDVSYKWLLKNFGYPEKGSTPFQFNEKDFPKTFAVKKITIDHLLDDLCNLFAIDRKIITYELEYDVRDIPMTPYSIQGKAFESELVPIKEGYDTTHFTIHIANKLIESEYVLLRRLIVELSKIKLIDKKPEYLNSDLTYFSYIAATFFGFSILISQALIEIGMRYRAGWQRQWRTKAEVPYQIIAYAVANYSKLVGEGMPDWQDKMPLDVKVEFILAMRFLNEHPDDNTFLDEKQFEDLLKAQNCWEKALQLSKNKKYSEAIELYKLSMTISPDKNHLVLAYINCGYAYLMLEQYDESLEYYNKALEIKPGYAYAFANMGFIYTMKGQLDKAKEYLEKVDAYDNTLEAYLLRDWALYYIRSGNNELAEDYFERAFNTGTNVDLLEYYFAKFLLDKQRKEEALEYLKVSVDKGEPSGIALMNALS